jgi:AraC-like DNA-binding protein
MAKETFLATFGLIGLRLLELHGIDPQRFAQQAGIGSTDVPNPKTRMAIELADKAFERAAQLIPDPAFALRAPECWHPSYLGTLGYAWLSSGSLRSGLKRLVRYSRILGQKAVCRCDDLPDGLHFVFDHGRGDKPIGSVLTDFALSLFVGMCRENYGPSLSLDAVTLRRVQPADTTPYTRYFGCPITFGAKEDSFVLAGHIAERPLPTANHELVHTFDSILAEQLADLQDADLESRCRAYLLQELTSGEPSEEELAKAMAMSRRTLQRKLGELGLTYRSLLERTRYDLAMRYLEDPKKSVTDITFLLGFSEQSAFTRAFKRWSGKAPTEYRETANA